MRVAPRRRSSPGVRPSTSATGCSAAGRRMRRRSPEADSVTVSLVEHWTVLVEERSWLLAMEAHGGSLPEWWDAERGCARAPLPVARAHLTPRPPAGHRSGSPATSPARPRCDLDHFWSYCDHGYRDCCRTQGEAWLSYLREVRKAVRSPSSAGISRWRRSGAMQRVHRGRMISRSPSRRRIPRCGE